MMIRIELLTPRGDFLSSATYNKVFTQHGILMIFFFLIPAIPATLGNFLADDDRRERSRVPTHKFTQLVYLHSRRNHHHLGSALRRRRYRLDFLRAIQHDLFEYLCCSNRPRHFHKRLLLNSDRTQLHRHDSHDARAGYDMVPPAAIHLVALRDVVDHDSGHARGAITILLFLSSVWRESEFSIQRSVAIRCCSNICSGSIRTRPFTS